MIRIARKLGLAFVLFMTCLTIVLCVSLLPSGITSVCAQGTVVQIGDATLATGGIDTVEIWVKNFPNDGYGLGCYTIRIDYDPSMIEVTGVLPGDAPFNTPVFKIYDDYVSIAQFTTAWPGPTGNIRTAKLQFSCLKSGASTLSLTIQTLANTNGVEIPATALSGTITQSGTSPSPSPTTTSIPPPTPTPSPTSTPTSTTTPTATPTSIPTTTPSPTALPTQTTIPVPMLTTSPVPTTTPESTPTPTPVQATTFIVSNLTVTPTEVRIGEPATISAEVVNTSDVQRSYSATLKINGVAEETKELTLSDGLSAPITFTVTKYTPGSYQIEIGGQSGEFTVLTSASTPNNWRLVGGVIGAVIVVVLISTVLIIKRRDAAKN